MAIKYFCDYCGEPALTREQSDTQNFSGTVSVPTIAYKDTHLEIIIRKDVPKERRDHTRREDFYADICMDCLIDAVRHGELDK